MKAIRLQEPRRFEYLEIDEPAAPGAGQVLVRTHRMGICGSDLAGYLGKMPFYRYPRIPGHELGVEVLAVGPDVTNVAVGDRCSVEPYMNCGTCYACRHAQPNCCEHLNVIGVMIDGGLCERFLIRAEKLHPSSVLNYDQLALVETLAIGCHATQRGNPLADEHVLIIGAGPIGLSVLEFTRLTGATITVMDMDEKRLAFCKETYQVAHTIHVTGDGSERDAMNRITNGDRFAMVVDATGSNVSMAQALHFVAQSGRLVYVGITTGEITFPHAWMHRPEVSMLASRNALPNDFRRIISLIEDGTINTQSWLTHHVPFDELADQFEKFTKPQTGAIKAIVHVT